jgi:hypothetical protein
VEINPLWHFLIDHHVIFKVNLRLRNEDKPRKEVFMERNIRFNGIWQNGVFKIKIKGSAYVSFYNNSRYGKGTITYDNDNFILTSSQARWMIFWKPFVESVKGKYFIGNDELTVSDIKGRYSDYNGKWVRLKK